MSGALGVVRTPRRRFTAGAVVGAGVAGVALVTTGGCRGAATMSTVAIAVSLSLQSGTVPDLVSLAPSAEGAIRLVLAATPAGDRTGRVDQLGDAGRKVRL